jgi:hypothetical protein
MSDQNWVPKLSGTSSHVTQAEQVKQVAVADNRRDVLTCSIVADSIIWLSQSGFKAAAGHLFENGVRFETAHSILTRGRWRGSDITF